MIDFAGQRVHLLGIGGSGVSALVPLLQAAGALVDGCDGAASSTTRRLQAEGVSVRLGHDPGHVAGVDIVVHTAAVPADHPELVAARAAGATVLTRGQCLVEILARRRTIAVAGSHGKTSTTWMLGHLLTASGADPLVMVGGTVGSLGGGARAGTSGLAVAEVDESDGSFARTAPQVAIVTNLDAEHLRHYGTFAALEEAFNAWLRTVPADGLVIVPATGLSPRVLAGVTATICTIGLDRGDWQVRDLHLGPDGSTGRVVADGQDLGFLTVTIPGVHMVLNALMAAAAARFVHPATDLGTLATCERVKRRFTVHGRVGGVRIVEDYGHHPAEIRATIAAAALGGGTVRVLFQPHRHSRTADCFDEFITAFDQAGHLSLLPIFGAGEPAIPGITSEALAMAVAARRPAMTVLATADRPRALAHALAGAAPGDTLLILGAGDVGDLAHEAVRTESHAHA